MEKENLFEKLSKINVSDKIEKKNGLSYLSWSWAWSELKKYEPNATVQVYENKDGWNYHHDGQTAWVKVGVTAGGVEYIEYLPVMDFRNQSIRLEKITSMDINKSTQRALTKAIARHGLGMYIYAGEDLPEIAVDENFKDRINLCTTVSELNQLFKTLNSKEQKLYTEDFATKKHDLIGSNITR